MAGKAAGRITPGRPGALRWGQRPHEGLQPHERRCRPSTAGEITGSLPPPTHPPPHPPPFHTQANWPRPGAWTAFAPGYRKVAIHRVSPRQARRRRGEAVEFLIDASAQVLKLMSPTHDRHAAEPMTDRRVEAIAS